MTNLNSDLKRAAQYYQNLSHQDKAWDWLEEQIIKSLSSETIDNFLLRYRDAPAYLHHTPLAAKDIPAEDSSSTLSLFQKALKFTLVWEGGYVDHPNDLGGPTNYGIIQETYNTYRQRKGLTTRSVKDITIAERDDIYLTLFWDELELEKKGEEIPRFYFLHPALKIILFDNFVQFHSKGAAFSFLREALGLGISYTIDSSLINALRQNNTLEFAKKVCQCRINYRHQRAKENPSQEVFLQGWLNRDYALIKYMDKSISKANTLASTTPFKPSIY
jgi:lysozyme family protein